MPEGLQQISLCERAWWQTHGPLLEAELDGPPPHGYSAWPSWDAFVLFYKRVRDELFVARPWLRESSVAEALFAAHESGQNIEAVRDAYRTQAQADDPRLR